MDALALMEMVGEAVDATSYQELNWQGSLEDYLRIATERPEVVRNAYQRIHDMILAYGVEEADAHKGGVLRYKFFDDPSGGGRDAIFGLDRPLMRLMHHLKSAAHSYGSERRVLLLHGPVGSSKSTIVRLLKKGLEDYSRTEEGALYAFEWELPDGTFEQCPMHEEPLHLIPSDARECVLDEINSGRTGADRVRVSGDLCPFCRHVYREYLARYNGDWNSVVKHVRVRRFVISEKDRVGIGTFQPKDEKNQDSTELTGDINYRKIAQYGSDSDPRAFNFDGEFNIANRGLIEFVEVLKLEVAFLYDLLGASQERKIKPKKFAQTDIDEVIIGHTNEPEYRKLQSNEMMEAFRDRTIKIDIPYNTKLDDEIRIYQKDYNSDRVQGVHIAPHCIEMAAMWAVLTRLQQPKKVNLSLLQKLKLYNGRSIPGFTEDSIRELRDEAPREGMEGISPRYIQDRISSALVSNDSGSCVNPFMILNELEDGLAHHALITTDDERRHCAQLIAVVRQEYEEIAKNDVQRAISADEDSIARLCSNYVDHIKACTQNEKVRNKYTGQDEQPDEHLMRSIEEKIDIPESRKDDFRREIMNYIGALAVEGRQFDFRSNERLHRALEMKLFDDQKDSIKLTSLVSPIVDRQTQQMIEVVKSRLISNYGYCDVCATDVLNFVASIFARGDVRESAIEEQKSVNSDQ